MQQVLAEETLFDALFQILVSYGLYDTRVGLALVYVSIQLPLTIYILESFFARIPSSSFLVIGPTVPTTWLASRS